MESFFLDQKASVFAAGDFLSAPARFSALKRPTLRVSLSEILQQKKIFEGVVSEEQSFSNPSACQSPLRGLSYQR